MPLSSPHAPPKPVLPIDAALGRIAAAVAEHGGAIVRAEPAAGKTTRIPMDLLDRGLVQGEIWVAEPRRMAAVLAARYVAEQRGEEVGETVGYTVRFDEAVSPRTRLRYVTDGLLLRRLAHDPELRGIGCVIFDEFHERRLAMDLGLAAVRALARRRPDLRRLVMSATLDVDELGEYLGDLPRIDVAGRTFPVTIEHAATLDQRPLPDQVVAALRKLLHKGPTGEGLDGDVLVFLPGAYEIRKTCEALAPLARDADLAIRPLHGALPLAEQNRALAPEGRRKVVVSTNIAETSLTLPGVTAVIDAGLVRQAGHAPWSGLPTLQLRRISKASATQRAGRAGRVRPGRCLRLYTQHEAESAQPYDKPEILRSDLAEALLQAAALAQHLSVPLDRDFWLSPPEPALVAQAEQVLERLGALEQGRVTALGRQLLELPVHPRLGRVVLAAAERGAGQLAALAVALLAEGELGSHGDPQRASELGSRIPHGDSDLLALVEAVAQDVRGPRMAAPVEAGIAAARRVAQQLSRQLRLPPDPAADVHTALNLALLAGFGDRLARRRQPGGRELEMPGGRRLVLGPRSQVTEPAWLLVLDAEERREAHGNQTTVRVAHGVAVEEVFEALLDRTQTSSELLLEKQAVQRVERVTLDGLELERTLRPAPASPEVSALLAKTWLERDPTAGLGEEELAQLQCRVQFVREQAGVVDLPGIDGALLAEIAAEMAEGCTRLDQLGELQPLLLARLDCAAGGRGLQVLAEQAPEFITLAGGRKLRIHYESDRPPWASSRLQDFLGLRDGPRVAGGRVPVVLHLLAPSQRPVQVSTDLAGFWSRHYPALRRELSRNYPKHYWPEDPLTAAPPPPNRLRPT